MHPFLLDFGVRTLPFLGEVRLALPTYGVMLAIALLVGWTWFVRLARRDGIEESIASSIVFWAAIAGILGAKLGLVLVEPSYYLGHPRQLLSAEFLSSAGVVWTGVIAGLGTLLWLGRRARLPLGTLLDAATLPLPLSQAIGRFGCLFAGCCFGAPTTLPWGITYHDLDAHLRTSVPLGTPLHPAPLYESAWHLAAVLPALCWVRRHRKHHGEVVLAYLAIYGVGRFVIERTRGDEVRGILAGGLSTSQWISLAMILVAIGGWVWLRHRPVEATEVA